MVRITTTYQAYPGSGYGLFRAGEDSSGTRGAGARGATSGSDGEGLDSADDVCEVVLMIDDGDGVLGSGSDHAVAGGEEVHNPECGAEQRGRDKEEEEEGEEHCAEEDSGPNLFCLVEGGVCHDDISHVSRRKGSVSYRDRVRPSHAYALNVRFRTGGCALSLFLFFNELPCPSLLFHYLVLLLSRRRDGDSLPGNDARHRSMLIWILRSLISAGGSRL